MIYHLSCQSTIARQKFSAEAWVKALNLAMAYGWLPAGTHLSPVIECCGFDPEEWDGTYLTNDGQTVLTRDALALAAALERALDDIPDFGIELDHAAPGETDDEPAEALSPVERAVVEAGLEEHLQGLMEIHPFQYFAGERKLQLVDFIRFCRLGSFTILRI